MTLDIDVNDLLRRAVHTFLQAFIAVLGVTWAASGIDVSQIDDLASAKKIALSVVAAVVAAALSALKTTAVALLPGTKTVDSDMGTGSLDDTDDELSQPTPRLEPLVTGVAAPAQTPRPAPGKHEADDPAPSA